MAGVGSGSCCACCKRDLGRGPRYVVDFRACCSCLRRHQASGMAAPLQLPGADRLQERMRASGTQHVCHLCQRASSEPVFGAIPYDLCEGCHHELPATDVWRCFTASLTRLSTGRARNDVSSQPSCDGCASPTGSSAFLLTCFACSTCAGREGLLRGMVRRLPCSVLPDKRKPQPADLFRPIPRRILDVSADRAKCTACCSRINEPVLNVINYVLCGQCRDAPPREVWYHFKGFFIRVMADFSPGHAQQYLQTQPKPTQLGEGGFGKVFKVTGKTTRRLYAQKVVCIDRSNREEAQAEALMMMQCCHPNIVECSEAYYSSKLSQLFILLEFATRGDLGGDIAKKRGGFGRRITHYTEHEIWSLLDQIASGLSYLHARGIVHRDLKPNNVLICETHDGQPIAKITDFGLARQLSEEWRRISAQRISITAGKTAIAGTPFYIPPEIVVAALKNREMRPTPASDVWALGCILWEMAYLTHPFFKPGVDWLKVKYQNVPRQPPMRPPRSAALQKLISAMLEPDPGDRTKIEEVLEIARRQRAAAAASGSAANFQWSF